MQNALIDAIREELDRDPALDAARIRIVATEAALVLAGKVHSYSEKCRAESLARAVAGETPVQSAIEVRLSVGNYRTDDGLTHLANELLENHVALSAWTLRAFVEDGWVTLRGTVRSDFHRATAEEVVRELAGVRGITNEIRVVGPSGFAMSLVTVIAAATAR